MVEAVESLTRRRVEVNVDLVEFENPLFEVVVREPTYNDGGQLMNLRENGRFLMALGLDDESQNNGYFLARYLAFDTDKVTDVMVIDVSDEETRVHQRNLYKSSHLEADVGDCGVLVFYNKQE